MRRGPGPPPRRRTVPELPEVETVRLGLRAAVLGRTLTSVEVSGRRSVRRQPPAELVGELSGRTLLGARRRGKYLLVDLDDAAVLVVHLRMSGQLLLVGASEPLAKHTHVRIHLDDGRELRFVDPRTFGELFVTDELDERRVPLVLGTLGVDPLGDGVAPEVLGALLARRKTALKSFLLDQSAICGIGNIYADEICFAARLSPLRRTETLRRAEIARLAPTIEELLGAAVLAGGSSLVDARYKSLSGSLGTFQNQHAVYGRFGQPCRRCRGRIARAKVGGRSTHYCDSCQH